MTSSTTLPWSSIEWVLLDMDGTILDLAYDNYFWRTLVPERYALARGIDFAAAKIELDPHFTSTMHTLPWYCTDHWSTVTGLDIAGLKREIKHRIAMLDGAELFLRWVKDSGRKLWLATNAHADSWQLKLQHTGLAHYFDTVICSHDFGVPKEHPLFWQRAQDRHGFDPSRTLFVDDSIPVVQAAIAYPIAHVRLIRCPDTTTPPRDTTGFAAVDGLIQLLP